MIFLKNILRFTVFILSCFLSTPSLIAQDPHFNQFYNVPGYANPALIGTSNANYRVSTVFRDQWQGGLEKPITSFVFGGDLKFGAGGIPKKPDIVGIGIMFLNDKVSAFDYITNQISVTGAYHKLLDYRTSQYIGIGMQTSILTKSLGYGQIYFGDQFNAIDGFTLPTAEELSANNLGAFDLNLGVNYSISPYDDQAINIGLAGFHLFSPDLSFYNQDEILSRRFDTKSLLPLRWTLHANYKYPITPSIGGDSRIVANKQAIFSEINASQLLNFYNPLFKEKSMFIGPGVRFSNFQDKASLQFESINLTVGAQINKMVISASFEHALSPLVSNRKSLNSFEFSFILFGNYDNEVDICPKF